MNNIKKAFGLIWLLLGPAVLFYLIKTAAAEINRNPALNTKVQWSVFILIAIPISVGLVLFGYYALKGEYEEVQ